MPYFRVQQIRSTIGLPKKMKLVLEGLGLHRRNAVAYHDINPASAGSILKVKELVSVETAPEKLTREQIRASRKSNPGFYVESR
ncbi:mitochondrial 54S ribosomal protein uL30m [Dipodascopsis tothii]|uniref:mitochondrial 54S ribosomal protein uL30m n=1 Tax=Dipodascopsis tothii TaxID=44089 RepID=UPI0034D001C8